MQEVVIKVYEINELSEKARRRAYNDWLENICDYDTYDIERTLKSFCDLFGVNVYNWRFDECGYDFSFQTYKEEIIDNMKGERLFKYLMNNFWSSLFKKKTIWKNWEKRRTSNVMYDNCCVLTGVCYDEWILEPIYEFLKHPNDNDFYDLIDECLNNFFKNCVKDYEYMTSEEYFVDSAEDNEIMFYENGAFYG
jgi:hypothetical protein